MPADYVIGPETCCRSCSGATRTCRLTSSVRPDGKISLPLLNDIQAGGLTPDQLREARRSAAQQFVEDPSVTVVVKQINSRKVFITGQVEKPGPYPLTGRPTVLQLIAMAGGLQEFADGKNIVDHAHRERPADRAIGSTTRTSSKRKNLAQNIELKPGDTVVVP